MRSVSAHCLHELGFDSAAFGLGVAHALLQEERSGEAPVQRKRPIGLLHIFPSFARGGQQMRLASIAAALESEFSHRIVSLDEDVSAGAAFRCVEIETLRISKTGAVSVSNVMGLGEIIRRSQADIVCTYNFGSLEAAIANSIGPRRPHVHYEDGFGPDETPDRQKWRRVLLRRLVLQGSVVVVPSRTLESVALRKWRLRPGKVMRIPNGIEVSKFAEAGASRRSSSAVVVGSMGALRPEKNFHRLIRAFEAGGARGKLAIYGEGPEWDRLGAAASGLGDKVSLMGQTEAPEQAYAAFDVFALSSDTEQMPLSLMEAMASGLPVVATDVGDVKEMVAPENREFVIAPENEAGFAQALARLAGDGDLRARLGQANAAKARNEFGIADMVASHAAIFRTLAGSAA